VSNRKIAPPARAVAHLPLLVLAAALGLAGCDDFPKDIAGTMKHAQERGAMRTGLVAAGGDRMEAERQLGESVAKAAGIKMDASTGNAEVLLHRLEEGDLDIVLGDFAKKSPWKGRVAFTVPASAKDPDKKEPVLRAAVRSGENHWLMFVGRIVEGGKG